MTNQEAIKMLTAKVECMQRDTSGTDIDCNLRNCDDCELCYAQGETGEQREALNMAISALQEQRSCDTCKHSPVSKKWPCVDCDMREPADRWEAQDGTDTNVGSKPNQPASVSMPDVSAGKPHDRTTDDCISRRMITAHLKQRLWETALNNVGIKCDADEVYSDIANNRLDSWMNELCIKELPSAQHEREYTMEEFMFGQDMGNPEDGSL